MSSTPQSVPVKRRSQGRLAIAVGVLVAIAVAVTLIAVTGRSNPTLRTSAGMSQASPRPAAAVGGSTVSSPTVQPNPDQQGTTSQLAITSRLLQQQGKNLPGWLLR